jgi:mRNA-degrading endonuclease toxin of MazEF toxin-antitoxin module
MVRGDVYFVDLAPRSGAAQRGRRPAIVVSTDAFNEARGWRSITIVPLTTAARWLDPSPTTVVLELGEANLPKRCAAVAHQLTTIDKTKLVGGRVGQLSAARLAELGQALRNYLELE